MIIFVLLPRTTIIKQTTPPKPNRIPNIPALRTAGKTTEGGTITQCSFSPPGVNSSDKVASVKLVNMGEAAIHNI